MDLLFILLGVFYYQIKSTFFIVFPNAILCGVLRMNGIVIGLWFVFLLFHPGPIPIIYYSSH